MSNQNQYGTERALGRLASTIHRRLTMANLWLFGCLGVAAFLAIRSFVTTQTESPTSVRTEAVSANSGTIERAIEDFRVGDRMAPVENPAEEFDDSLGLEVDPATWRKLTLKATKDDGTCCDIDLLRPNWWIEEESAEVGGKVYVSVPECGIESFAEVLAIESCPPIQPGRGPVVTGTFAHQSAEVINIHVEGLDEPIGTTTNHPFWSDTREEFVAAGELHPGERLHGIKGNPRITKILPRGPPEPVYNLEVFGEHVYQVSSSGLLVHNGKVCPPKFVNGTKNNPVHITGSPRTGLVRGSNSSRLVFEGTQVRAVRNLSHVDESTLRVMRRDGFAAKDINGKKLDLHHLNQNPNGPLVEIPRFRHNAQNPVQHPLGTAPGVGLTKAQRDAHNAFRVRYWKERALEELLVRGLTP